MYETLTYTGGVHKHEEMTELIEDLRGIRASREYKSDGSSFNPCSSH